MRNERRASLDARFLSAGQLATELRDARRGEGEPTADELKALEEQDVAEFELGIQQLRDNG